MNGLPYYKAYPRDFIEGTIGMTFELKAAYRLVLDLIYLQGGKLPDDARYISGLLGCSVRAWNKYRAGLIEAGKIHAENGIIFNFRADKELESLRTHQEVKRENRAGSSKNNGLAKRPSDDTEPDTDKRKREPNGSPKKRASRLPEDWTLPAEWRQDALDVGLPESRINTEAAKIHDWSRSSTNGAKLDWPATWRNWCRRAAEAQPRASPANRKDTPADAARRRIEAIHDERNRSETDNHQPTPRLISSNGERFG